MASRLQNKKNLRLSTIGTSPHETITLKSTRNGNPNLRPMTTKELTNSGHISARNGPTTYREHC